MPPRESPTCLSDPDGRSLALRTRVGRRILKWGLVIGVCVWVLLLTASYLLLRPESLKARLVEGLTKHLNLEAEVGDISVTLFPRPQVTGTRLVLRVPSRPDLPPFVSIDRFTVAVGPLAVLRKHVKTVHVDGLKIVVPPSNTRSAVGSSNGMPKVIVDHLIAHDAVLTFVPKSAKRPPLLFEIHSLNVQDVGFGQAMPFTVVLTNPVPTGRIDATGTVGPWRSDDGTLTAVAGKYTFTDADLGTINGIGGRLNSTGEFRGHLAAIDVDGQAEVPDFSLDLGGKPAPLSTTFTVVVDGTDGAVELKRVDAKLASTAMSVTGVIANLPGPGRRDVQLSVRIPDGRLEHLLALAIDAPRPVMTGAVALETHVSLPPGKTRVRDRIDLRGRFGLSQARFTDKNVQQKIQELSRRSQGKSADEELGRTFTDLQAGFVLKNGTLSLSQLEFEVPGAAVLLDGSYDLSSTEFDLHGVLRMQASVSRAIGGVKSIFIKPFNFLFRKDGAGAVVPIRISGPRTAPKFTVEFGKVFGRGK